MLNFNKFLKGFKNHAYPISIAQASLEYVILMAVLIGLLAVWLGSLFPNLRGSLEANFFNPAVEKIVSSDTGGSSPGPSGPSDPDPGPEPEPEG